MKKGALLRNMGIVIVVLSAMSIIVRLPVGSKLSLDYFNLQFWSYMVVSPINLYIGLKLYRGEKNSDITAIYIIAATFIVTETVARLTTPAYEFGYTIMGMLIPGTLITFLLLGRSQLRARR